MKTQVQTPVPVSPPSVTLESNGVAQTSSDRVTIGRDMRESNDDDSRVPLWKRNLMRKRQKEEEQKQTKEKNDV